MITRPSFVMLATVSLPSSMSKPKTARRAETHRPQSSAGIDALLPDGDVFAALARERRAVPVAPALAQRHACELSHQVELRGPDVAERHRQELPAPVGE